MKFLIYIFLCTCFFLNAQSNTAAVIESEHDAVIVPVYIDPPVKMQIFETVDVSAIFPGGVKEMARYIQKNKQYPTVEKENNLEGICKVKCVITSIGEIMNAEVSKGLSKECDIEALRIVKAMPRWKPAKVKGVDVNCYYTIPVEFKIYK